MKAVFKQNIRNMRFYAFAGCSLVLLGLALIDYKIPHLFIIFLMLWFPLLMIFRRSYKITDDDILTGSGKVPIKSIQKLVRQPDSIVAYYQQEKKDKMHVKPYFVEDKELFIEKLKEINPDIQVI